MAEVTINNSPIHSDSIITACYGETGEHWSAMHTGSDFAPYGTTPSNPDLYSVCTGAVVDKITYTGSQLLGNQIVIQDLVTGYFWRYCHMQNPSPLDVGMRVYTTTKVGNLGATGNVTGPHLHLEYSSVSYWDSTRTKFFNPLTELGIPDERGTIVHYGGPPPQPPTTLKKGTFNWTIYARKLRDRRRFDIN